MKSTTRSFAGKWRLASVSVKISDRDKGYKKMRKNLRGGVGVSIGIFADKAAQPYEVKGKQKTPATVLDVAIWNEFGTSRIPPRSFLRAPFDERGDVWRGWWKTLWKAVARGDMAPEQAAELFGMKIVGELQQRISDGIPPPNADSTVRQKGSSTPLINTGQLRSSITFKVVRQ